MLRDQRFRNDQPCQPRRLRFFGQWCGSKKTLPRRDAAGPAVPAKERGNSRTKKRAVLILKIDPPTCRNGKPASNLEIVLNKYGGRRIPVGEMGNIARKKN